MSGPAQWLGQIPDLYAVLPLFRRPGSRPADDSPKPATREFRQAPVALHVLHLIEHTPTELALWCEAGPEPGPSSGVPTMAAWLAERADWYARHWTGFVPGIASLHRDLMLATGEHPERTYHCPGCGNVIEPRWAEADQRGTAASWWACTGCERTWVLDAELARLGGTQPDLTVSELADWLGLSKRYVHRWVAEGKLLATGRRGRARVFDRYAAQRLASSLARVKTRTRVKAARSG